MATDAEPESDVRAGVFKVEELTGTVLDSFAWVSSKTPPPDKNGGARACPQGQWQIGASLRTVRTEYPGATSPSEQVLGAQQEEQNFQGSFDDRYNYPGYAIATMRGFEDLCRRGTTVRISFQAQSFIGIIRTWKWNYKRASEIGYEFTASIHKRSEWVDHAPAEGNSRTLTRAVRDVDEATAVLLEQYNESDGSRASLGGGSAANVPSIDSDVRSSLLDVSNSRDALTDTVDQQSVNAAKNPLVTLGRITAHAQAVQAAALNVTLTLAEARSDVVCTGKSAMAVLNFEVWSRSLRGSARLVMGQSRVASEAAQERSDPTVKALCRPYKGESLYSISNRYYGTPHAWRLIADRNGLRTMTLMGDEVLLIPERGEPS